MTTEWRLWIVPVLCALHALEEYFSGWQAWAVETLGIAMPTSWFALINAVLVVAAVFLARVGWRQPALSLVIPAATLINAVFFHILPTFAQQRVSPGLFTAMVYVPFSSWVFVGARRDGVSWPSIVVAVIAGAIQMTLVVQIARWFSNSS